MNTNTVRVLLAAVAVYMIWKTASGPKRGTFFTLFGNIRRENQPKAFRACLLGGYALAGTLLLGVAVPGAWLPLFSGR